MDIWQIALNGIEGIARDNMAAMVAIIAILLIIVGLNCALRVMGVSGDKGLNTDEAEIKAWKRRRRLGKDWERMQRDRVHKAPKGGGFEIDLD